MGSFLPLIELCDNFKLDSAHPFPPSELATFCLSAEHRSAVGLLFPEVIKALRDYDKQAVQEGRKASWILIDHDPTVTGSSNNIATRTVHFAPHLSTSDLRSEAISSVCTRWRDVGLFSNVMGGRLWRSELYPVYTNPFGPHVKEALAFEVERACAALFGVITYGVHMTIYQSPAPESGKELKIWVPTRAKTKQTWPGYLDNTVAGGVPSGMPAFESLVKESMEEASIAEDIIRKHARGVGAISYFFRTRLGWLQPEVEFVYDLEIPTIASEGEIECFHPKPLDGEVESFELLPLSKVIEKMHQKLFKPNCALVIIDFLIRHGYVTPENEPNYMEIITRLHGRFEFDRW